MMWHPHKWLDDLAEQYGWWIVPCIILGRVLSRLCIDYVPENISSVLVMLLSSGIIVCLISCFIKKCRPLLRHYHMCLYLHFLLSIIIYPSLIFYFIDRNLALEGSLILGTLFFLVLIVIHILLKIVDIKLKKKVSV